MSRLDIAGVVKESITDGIGMRFVLFVQGCPHHCPGCHNPATHEFGCGEKIDIERIFEEYKKNPLLRGITFSGGEPFCQAAPLALLAEKIIAANGDIWTYSGYTLERLLEIAGSDEGVRRLLELTDVLVDGPFIMEQKSLTLRFRGSRNQRIIDLKKTREGGYNTIIAFKQEDGD